MFEMWDVPNVGILECGCSADGMFGMQNVQEVEN